MLLQSDNMTRGAGRWALGLSLLVLTTLSAYGLMGDLPQTRTSVETEHVQRAVRFGGTRNLNPQYFIHPPFFSYVLLGLYGAMYVVGRAAGWLQSVREYERLFFTDPTVFLLAGRLLTLGLGLASLLLCYRVARRLFGEQVACWTAAFMAITPVVVTWAHYASADIAMLSMSLLAFSLMVGVADTGRWRYYLGAGFVLGLASATKYQAVLLGPAFLVAHLLRGREERTSWVGSLRSPKWMVGCLCVAAGFVVGCPFAVLDYGSFLASFNELVKRARPTDYYQFASWRVDQPGWWYIPIVVLPFALSAPVAVLCLAGLGYSAWRRERGDYLLLAGILPLVIYLAGILPSAIYMGSGTTIKPRYFLPVVPLLLIAGMRVLLEFLRRLRRVRPALTALAGCSLALMPLWQTWQFDRQAAQPLLTTQAKRWVEAHLPTGTSIAMLPGVPLAPNRAAIERQLARVQARGHMGVRLSRLLRYVDDFPTTYNVYELAFPWRDDFDVADFDFSRLHAAGVEYVITTTHLRDYLADPARYAAQVAFYHDMQRSCELIKHFQGDPPLIDVGFPYAEEVDVYDCRSAAG